MKSTTCGTSGKDTVPLSLALSQHTHNATCLIERAQIIAHCPVSARGEEREKKITTRQWRRWPAAVKAVWDCKYCKIKERVPFTYCYCCFCALWCSFARKTEREPVTIGFFLLLSLFHLLAWSFSSCAWLFHSFLWLWKNWKKEKNTRNYGTKFVK